MGADITFCGHSFGFTSGIRYLFETFTKRHVEIYPYFPDEYNDGDGGSYIINFQRQQELYALLETWLKEEFGYRSPEFGERYRKCDDDTIHAIQMACTIINNIEDARRFALWEFPRRPELAVVFSKNKVLLMTPNVISAECGMDVEALFDYLTIPREELRKIFTFDEVFAGSTEYDEYSYKDGLVDGWQQSLADILRKRLTVYELIHEMNTENWHMNSLVNPQTLTPKDGVKILHLISGNVSPVYQIVRI